jgi:hypothetical protein
LWIKKNLKRMRDLRVLRVGVSFAPLIRGTLRDPSVSQTCHPDPFGKLRTGSAKDYAFFFASSKWKKNMILQFAANTPLLQDDNVRGFR